MTGQAMGRRALVLGAGVLLIGSLGVGTAMGSSYSDVYCTELTTYYLDNSDPTTGPTLPTLPTLPTTLPTLPTLPSIPTEPPDIELPDLESPDLESPDLETPDLETPTDGGSDDPGATTVETVESAVDPIAQVDALEAAVPSPSPSPSPTTNPSPSPDDDGDRLTRYDSTECYVHYSYGHYYYDYRPVGEVYASQVRSVPVGGVDTGN